MPQKPDYVDNTLIKLVRLYSKDETVAAFSKKLTEVEIQLGQARAYILELEYERSKVEKELLNEQKKHKETKQKSNEFDLEARKNQLIKSIQKTNATLRVDNKRLRESNADLVNKLVVLQNNSNQKIK